MQKATLFYGLDCARSGPFSLTKTNKMTGRAERNIRLDSQVDASKIVCTKLV